MRAPALTFARARSLRPRMTLPEVLLWREIRGAACGGLRFRRQHPIGAYVLDFFCASHKLAVEVDGAIHDQPSQAAHDAERERWLETRGISVLRFRAVDVLHAERRRVVLDTIAATPPPPPSAVPLPRGAGEDGLETTCR